MKIERERDSEGYFILDGERLLVRYQAGDYDYAKTLKQLHQALYDEHQCREPAWPDGAVFILDGKPVFKVDGVHVVEV